MPLVTASLAISLIASFTVFVTVFVTVSFDCLFHCLWPWTKLYRLLKLRLCRFFTCGEQICICIFLFEQDILRSFEWSLRVRF